MLLMQTPKNMRSHILKHLAFVGMLTACTDAPLNDDNGDKNSAIALETTTERSTLGNIISTQTSLHSLPRPNPSTMDSRVAAIVDSAWVTMDANISDTSISDKEQAQIYADYGLVAFGNGLTLPAETAFENATIKAPNDARWIYFLALLHQYNGKLENAVSSFNRSLELREDNLPALIRLADVYFEQADMKKAVATYQKILELQPKSASAHYGLGQIASSAGEHAQAITHFEKALQIQPSANRINYFLGLSWRNQGNAAKAKTYLAKHGPNEPRFDDPLFDEISGGEARIDGLWAHMNAGSQALVDGNLKLAVDEFKLATVDLPNDYRSWQSLGMALNRRGNIKDATLAYSKALALSENNAVIHHELAKLKLSSGALRESENHLKAAIKIDTEFLDAYKSYARLLSESGRFEQALMQLDSAIALDSQSGELAISRAETLVALKREEQAKNALVKMLQVNPNDANVRVAYGLVLAELKETKEATAEIQRALQSANNNAIRSGALYALGRVQLLEDKHQDAIFSFGESLKLNQNHRAAGLELARTFLRVRDFKQALATYEVHIGLWPKEDATRVEAARIALHLGDGLKAQKLMSAAASKGSASPRLLGSLARLQVLSTDTTVRNPEKALALAQRALKKSNAAQHRETLALCYASLSQWSKAIEVQNELLNIQATDTPSRVRTRMERNLSRYKEKTLGRLPFDAS